MSTIQELTELRSALRARLEVIHQEGKSVMGRAEKGGRDLAPSEQARLDALFAKFDATEAEIAKVDAEIIAIQDEIDSRSTGLAVPPMRPTNGVFPGDVFQTAAPLTGARTFSAMFPGARQAINNGFQSLGDFAKAVWQRDPRLFQNVSGGNESVGQDGGFYVPTGFYAGLMDASLQQEAVRPGATVIPMTSAQVDIPMFDLSDRSTGIATLEGKLTAEGATGTTQKAKIRTIGLTAKKISVLVPTTTELLQDAPQIFQAMLQQHMTDALGQTLDSWFISGNGAGVPLGILNAPCLVSVAKDGSQVAATLTPTNIAGMVSRLAPGSWSRATWLVSPSALAQLFTIKTVVTNVAGNENVGGFGPNWFTSNADGSFTLLGRPLIVTDRCQALGTKGDILLADLRSYLVGIRQNAELLVDASVGFKESEIWFRLNCRVDGQPALASAIAPRVGSATLSPFVSLDTRS